MFCRSNLITLDTTSPFLAQSSARLTYYHSHRTRIPSTLSHFRDNARVSKTNTAKPRPSSQPLYSVVMTGTLGSPKSYPTNGYGGSYYHEHFQGVPVYNHGSPATNNIVSWAAIDQYALEAISIIATNGICLGFCLATLVYTVSLTPREKRLKLFHIALLTALLFEIYRLLTVVAPASTPGISSFSSYISITKDVEATTFTNGYRGTLISGWFAGCLSYLFTVACLSLQAKGLLAGLELRYPTWHTVLFCYLLGISAIAFVANVVFNAFQAAHMSGSYQKFPFDILHTLVLALYAASLGSWCLVSLISVTWLVFTRFNMFRGTTHYDTALKIILLTVLDSFIVPRKYFLST